MKFPEHKNFDLSQINKDILARWEKNKTFEQSLTTREGKTSYVFYEGPPSANGMPGIHHVMARSIKDIFCRYKTMKGFHVKRKAGWDTHGLPVELGVEKALGITKEDIGKTITVAEYNEACRKDVMKFTNYWEDITKQMGFWLDMNDPYITYESSFIETLWWLLKEMYKKGLLYKGYTIQPYSPAAGTGLSSHELNLPGCYKDVKDTTAIVQFKIIRNEKSEFLFEPQTPSPSPKGEGWGEVNNKPQTLPPLPLEGAGGRSTDVSFIAWTTTPWTLLSNTALAMGAKISYVKIRTFNPYSGEPTTVIMAKDLMPNLFNEKNNEISFEEYTVGSKKIPFKVLDEYKGSDFEGIRYEQLLPYQQPTDGDAFRVLMGDFVTTEDGTGIVHIAPSFGADDFRVAKQNGVGSLTLVDRQGKFVDGTGEFSGKYVKKAFDVKSSEGDEEVDVEIVVKLKKENKLFKAEKHEHSYPHCWRTDKPILYYPLDSWFIKTTAMKDKMIALNKTINWQPQSTGTGRFGQWLENLVDWNLSRSRYWGTPLPIWRSEDGSEEICIGSFAELKSEAEKSVKAGFMKENPLKNFAENDFSKANYNSFDPHRPHVDEIILVSPSGKKMVRELDLIDVWFDSGAMPYAQMHYPFEHSKDFKDFYPADFIAEGVDQTRGWFFTLHAIAAMMFDSVAFKNIISNGLVLDKNGNKMSKRLGNAVDPFATIEKYGSDPLRWYMITNASPWDNLKFDVEGIEEARRKFFGTLYNTYSFFALYSNVDGFHFAEKEIPVQDRTEIDKWIISLLNTLIKEVGEYYETYEPTKAGRAINNFVTENLSNWYVRLNRKRFWGSKYDNDKIAAYQTLYTCLETIAQLMAPIAPFYADQLFTDLNTASGKQKWNSVHLSYFPVADESLINKDLEERMDIAQKVSSMVLSLRRKVNIKVRQPLNTIKIPVLDNKIKEQVLSVKNIFLTEVNVKELELITGSDSNIIVKKIKPNFKTLGPRFGKSMKDIANHITALSNSDISKIEADGFINISINGVSEKINYEDVEITTEDIPGWLVANDGRLTVALDINVSEELKQEGIAREFINRIQNLRKDSGFEVTDKILLSIQKHNLINEAINIHKDFICSQTLANSIILLDNLDPNTAKQVEIDDEISTFIKIEKA